MRFTRAVLLVTAVLLLGVAGPALAQTFIFGGQGEPVQFDPAVITDGISAKITRQIYDTLYEFKPGIDPGPARRWPRRPRPRPTARSGRSSSGRT